MAEDKLTRIGPYEVLQELGRGGFSVVYKARETSGSGRLVALKLLHPFLLVEPAFVRRFSHEADTVARLRHPNIVQLYDHGEANGRYYLAMEYIDGTTLEPMLKARSALDWSVTTSIIGQVAAALDYAHSQGVIHRDIKPGNVLVTSSQTAYLCDFGLAKAAEYSALTTSGQVFGTPEYMSPEQAQTDEGHPVDYRTDIYSLGVVLYQMCTGSPPFSGGRTSVMYKHVHEEPHDPSDLNPRLGASEVSIIRKALAKMPEQRFQSAGELARALHQKDVVAFSASRPSQPLVKPQPANLEGVDLRRARSAAKSIITRYAVLATGTAVATGPIPGTSLMLSGLETKMLVDVGKAYGRKLSLTEAGAVLGALVAVGMGVKAVAVEAASFVPIAGWLVKGGVAAGSMKALGELAIKYFEGELPTRI